MTEASKRDPLAKGIQKSVLGGAVVVCLIWAGASAWSGRYVSAVVALGLAAWWFNALRAPFTTATAHAERSYDANGTTLRPDQRLEHVGRMTYVLGIPVCAAMGLLGIYDMVHQGISPMHVSDGDNPVDVIGRLYKLVFGMCAFVLIPFWLSQRKNGMGWIRLDSDGYRFLDGLNKGGGRWNDLEAVTDQLDGARGRFTPLVFRSADGSIASIESSAMYAGPDGRPLYELVRYYWQHPESRGELTNGQALERFTRYRDDAAPSKGVR